MSLDFETRKAVAKWCRLVALENAATPDHAARVAVARQLILAISPATREQDTSLPGIVHLIRTFVGDDASGEAIETGVAQIMDVYLKLGVCQA